MRVPYYRTYSTPRLPRSAGHRTPPGLTSYPSEGGPIIPRRAHRPSSSTQAGCLRPPCRQHSCVVLDTGVIAPSRVLFPPIPSRVSHSTQKLVVACTPRIAVEHSGARHYLRTVAPTVIICRSCVARYIDMTFPLADACETCRAESPSGQPWLFGSLKEFQRAKLACQYAM